MHKAGFPTLSVGIVCPYDILISGGVQQHVLAVANELRRKDVKVTVIAPRPNGLQKNPKGVVMLGLSRRIKALKTTGEISLSLETEELDNFLVDNHFDILHFHEPWVPIMSRQILDRSSAKNIATFHAKLPESAVTKTLEKIIAPYSRKIAAKFDALTAVSDAASSYIRSVSKKPISIIPNGIELKKFKHKNIRKAHAKKQILFIGRLEKRKGVKYLLKAFALIKDSNLELLIAGNGPEEARLKNLADEYEIKNVKFLGRISDAKKMQLLKQADLFCSPALYGESFGIVLLEAMAAGVVTVAGNNPGYECVLTGTGRISLVNPKDLREFARRIEMLLTDKKLRKEWQAWAKKEIKQYDYGVIVDKYLELYKKVLKLGK